ncbi:MAG: type II toxin-antitoxin system RelE/ParE family toxin [Alphaproteobacteria bacterium]|nr:type II toxin-antitoxin system RelE/ParE family toxin [Alphaproteobacteria bacterium]
MIKSFRHKGLKELFATTHSSRVAADQHRRCLRRLDALNAAAALRELDLPGFHFHGLYGTPKRYSIRVNGPWRITFEWIDGDAWRVDLEQYH